MYPQKNIFLPKMYHYRVLSHGTLIILNSLLCKPIDTFVNLNNP
jgi:hypothetical protein